MEINFDLNEIVAAANQFVSVATGHKIFIFTGDLGAGKTTFIDAVCKAWNVIDNVSSPTYALIQEYETNDEKTIYHMDFYRVKSVEEAIDAGVEECLESGNICMIEWPMIIDSLMDDHVVRCELSITGNNQRKLVVQLP
ncbi:MAG: tRNA (adenosine(37)-N6)-threonylcarbamoyltransferase complex ATPase subunit type 1 TsaE [Ginsengibacter sp.]